MNRIKSFLEKNKKNPFFYVVLVLVYTLISYLNKKDEPPRDDTESTIDLESANSYADQLFQAMANTGTKENEIYSVLERVKTKANYNKVYNAFGKRKYIPGFGVYDAFFGNEHNLTIWLSSELNSSEQKKLNDLYPFVFN